MESYKKPEIKIFRGKRTGPSLLVFGAIHGDEVCGVFAIKKLAREIKSGKIILNKGSITLVPICNELAYKSKKRFSEENLNRIFKIWSNPDSYEKKVANDLAPLVKDCDIFLDIHSMQARSVPMIFIDYPKKTNLDFSRVLGATYGIMGWPELYKKNGEGIIPHDTMAYAEKFLKKCSIIECGQNNDLNSKKIAYQSIINTLIYFGFIEGKIKSKPLAIVQMKSLFIREHNEDKLSTKWGNFDKFKKGDVLACKADGEIILAPFDGVIILPNSKAKIGTEWFYLGLIK